MFNVVRDFTKGLIQRRTTCTLLLLFQDFPLIRVAVMISSVHIHCFYVIHDKWLLSQFKPLLTLCWFGKMHSFKKRTTAIYWPLTLYQVIVLNVFYPLSYFIFTSIMEWSTIFHSHFINKEIELKRLGVVWVLSWNFLKII